MVLRNKTASSSTGNGHRPRKRIRFRRRCIPGAAILCGQAKARAGAPLPPIPHPENFTPRYRPAAEREGAVRLIGVGELPNPEWAISFPIFPYSRTVSAPRIHSRRIDMVRAWGDPRKKNHRPAVAEAGVRIATSRLPTHQSRARTLNPRPAAISSENALSCKQRGVCMGIAPARAIGGAAPHVRDP